MALNEADTCRVYITPKLREVGWEQTPHSLNEQKIFTDGRVFTTGGVIRRGPQKRADYLLRFTRDFSIAVVEAKPEDTPAGDGLQQAKEYAEILGLKFAYATNGREIIEFDYTTGLERMLSAFPSPGELWSRLKAAEGMPDDGSRPATHALQHHQLGNTSVLPRDRDQPRRPGDTPRRAARAPDHGDGHGKDRRRFSDAWKLWSSRWNRTGEHRRPRILFLADRNVLVDDPKDKTFAPFGDARFKIEGGEISKSREMYFAIYQAIAKDERRPGLYKSYPRDFFDLIIVDECHRGSRARREQLARDSRVLRAGVPARHDRDSAPGG